MRQTLRKLFPYVVAGVATSAVVYAVALGRLEPADFTFNNQTEVKSLDPALVTGSPEGRLVRALFEGLMRQDPATLDPVPGMAERYEVSDDGLVYTFTIRDGAKWSNGEPVTAYDFEYSMRRFIDPLTAAEYAYQAWYIKNAKRYSMGAAGIRPGDSVELELHEPPEGALPFARGTLLHGELLAIEEEGRRLTADELDALAAATASAEESDEDRQRRRNRIFVVRIGTDERRFQVSEAPIAGAEGCKQILLDFAEVGIKALDERTFQTTLAQPTHYWLQLMSFYPLFPVNKTCVETHGSPQWTYPENIVSNGAFQLHSRRIRDRTRLVKSDTYWDRDSVRLNVVDALSVENATTAVNLFLTGKLDWIIEAPPAVMEELMRQDRNDLNPSDWFGSYFYRLNTDRWPLDDERVRRALSLATDREEIVRTATAAGEKPARSLVPPGLRNYTQQLSDSYDPAEARRLLEEAGFPNGVGFPKLSILYNTHENHRVIAEIVRKQWQRNLGIQVSTRNQEWGTYLSSQRQQEYDVCRAAWIGDYLDPYTFLDMFVTGGEQNNTGWSNARYDDLIEQSKKEVDAARRREMLEEAERILMDELPIVPIYYYRSKNMVKPHVRGYYNTIRDDHPLRDIWIDQESSEPNEFMRSSA